jgi:hypothetical protein
MFSRVTTLGSLKTSVSHLEFENGQLKRELAKVQTENREIEDRLVQEEHSNDDLKSRLDDARNLLTRRGYDPDGASAASRLEGGPGDSSPTPTLPAGQSSKKRRKPPVARIPGMIDTDPPADSKNEKSDNLFDEPTNPGRDVFGPQGRNDDLERWLPIAQAPSAPTPKQVR